MIPHEEGASGAGSSTEDEIMSASLEQGALGPEGGPDYWAVVALAANGYEATIVEQSPDCLSDDVLCNGLSFTDNSDDLGWTTGQPMGLYRLRLGFFHISDDDYEVTVRSADPLCQVSASAPASGAERMTAGESVTRFVRAVLHGDDEHRVWLMEAAECFVAGKPLPEPRGKGTRSTPDPATPPGVPDSVREAIARLINPTAFFTGPEAFGIPNEEDPRWKRTLVYGGRLFAYEKVEKIIALLATHPAGQSAGSGAETTPRLEPCPCEEPHLCCYPKCTCAADRKSNNDSEIDRILAMSSDELRAELVAEGHDPDALVRQMKQGLDGTLRLAADRQRWREEAASWRRVAKRLQGRVNDLEAGLKPFAAVLAGGQPVGPILRGLLDSRITRNNLRLATKLLASTPAPDSPRTGQARTDTCDNEKFSLQMEELRLLSGRGGSGASSRIRDVQERLAVIEGEALATRPPAPEAQGAEIEDRLSEILTDSQRQDLSDRLFSAYMAPHGGLRLDNAEAAYLWTKLGGAL